ncbi:MAG: FkbM family methyltransferase [Planctomycetes bacterium]|nr:FkbM family methyltransferase [Planctomycetota bacterium]MBI5962791.1 FkbM family methyltransferase [Chloroflexota bacterium]
MMKMSAIGWKIMNRVISKLNIEHDGFLQGLSGVVHVGANSGQERMRYDKYGLNVIWVEPIPEVFEKLKSNLSSFPNQHAFQWLVTDRDDEVYQFHVASNNGASSSILEMKHHRDVWPEIDYTDTIMLRSITLASLFEREQIEPAKYQALIMDTQGSELLILKGGGSLLNNFQYIKAEVPDFESYVGCCQLADINAFMKQQGYAEFSRHKFASGPGGGSYFDIVYRKKL